MFNGREVTPEELVLTQLDDGSVRIETAPLPEYILVASSLWDGAEIYDPQVDGDTGLEPPEHWVWRETVGHADPDRANDGTILHLDATNVHAGYKLVGEAEDGSKVLQLGSWAEL